MGEIRSYASFIAALVLFGSNGIVASSIALPSYQIVYLRTGLASLMLVALLLLSRKPLKALTHRKDLAFVALSGIAMGAGWLFLFEAYQRVGVSLSSLLYYCGPILVMVLSPVLFGERLGMGKLVCFAVVVLGLVLVNGAVSSGSLDPVGMACGVGAALSLACLVIANKKAQAITGLENSALQITFAFLTVAAFTVVHTGSPLVAVPEGQWLSVLVLGLVNTGLGCYLYFGVMGRLPLQSVAALGYLEPLTAVVLGVVLLGEPMSPLQMTGAVLIIGGAIACEFVGRAFRRAPIGGFASTARAKA